MPQHEKPDPDEPIEASSPVCYADELPPTAPPLPFERPELVTRLNALLENERALLRVLRNWSLEAGHDAALGAWTLAAMRDDATLICARLWDFIERLGVEPSSGVGPFHDQAMALSTWPDRLRHLETATSALVREVRATLLRVADSDLVALLSDTLERHSGHLVLCSSVR